MRGRDQVYAAVEGLECGAEAALERGALSHEVPVGHEGLGQEAQVGQTAQVVQQA